MVRFLHSPTLRKACWSGLLALALRCCCTIPFCQHHDILAALYCTAACCWCRIIVWQSSLRLLSVCCILLLFQHSAYVKASAQDLLVTSASSCHSMSLRIVDVPLLMSRQCKIVAVLCCYTLLTNAVGLSNCTAVLQCLLPLPHVATLATFC